MRGARKATELAHKKVNRALPELCPPNLTETSGEESENDYALTSATSAFVDPPARDMSEGPRIAPGPLFRRGIRLPLDQNVDYLLPPFLAALSSAAVPALPWPAGLRASPFLEPVLMPVVVPDFILLDFIR